MYNELGINEFKIREDLSKWNCAFAYLRGKKGKKIIINAEGINVGNHAGFCAKNLEI